MRISEHYRRIKEHGQQQVHPRDFLVSVVVVVLLLGAMGTYFMQTGHPPIIPPWLYLGFLVFVWASALLDILRHGRRALPLWRTAAIVGLTLYVLSQFVPDIKRLDTIGMILIVCGLFWQWVEVSKH